MKRIFDGLYVDQLFHKSERGETIFYPFGLMGQGYFLPAEREAGMRNATRWLMLVSLAFGVGFALTFLQFLGADGSRPADGLMGTAVFVLGLALINYIQMRLVSDLSPATAPRPSATEWLRRGREARATGSSQGSSTQHGRSDGELAA